MLIHLICIFIQLFLCRMSDILEMLKMYQEFEREVGARFKLQHSMRSSLRLNSMTLDFN